MTLYNKLDEINNGFLLKDYSISRFLIPIMFPSKFGVSFSDEELRSVGLMVRNRIKKNFHECLVPSLEYIIATTGGNFVNFTDESKKISSEFDLLKKLSSFNSSKLILSEVATNAIKSIRNVSSASSIGYSSSEVELYFHNWKEIYNSKKRFNFVYGGMKTSKSLAFKMLDRVSDIIFLTDYDHDRINSSIEKRNRSKINLTKEEIQKQSWNFLIEGFQSNLSFHDFFHLKAMEYGIVGPLYEIIGDLFVIDGARGKIVTTKKDIKYLNGLISNLPNIDFIKSRCDDFYHSNIKDRSIVYGIKGGSRNRNFAELRLQVLDSHYEGEFGEYAHFRYKRNKIRNLKNLINKRPLLLEATKNLSVAFNLTEEKIFNY